MKQLFFVFLSLLAFATPAELLENGDFSSSIQYWKLGRAAGYGKGNTIDVKNKELLLGNMEASSPGYLGLVQAVNLKKGSKYKLTFEAKGAPGQKIGVAAGDFRARKVVSTRETLTTTDWEPMTFEFTPKADTDAAWLKQMRKEGKKYKLGDGKTQEASKTKGREAIKSPDGIGACVIRIELGTYNGELALRNFSLVQLP